MRPEKKPSPSPLGYIPVETTDDADSTSNKSKMEVPTTTITVDAAHTSFATQPPLPPLPPLPPPPPILTEEQQALCGLLCLLLFVGAYVTINHGMDSMDALFKLPFQRDGPEIYIHSISFSVNNLSASQITTSGSITLNVTKAQDCAVSTYDKFEVAIFYEEKPLSMTIMEPFTQNEMNHTLVKATFPSIISPIETPVSKRLASYFTSNSSFEFSFDGVSKRMASYFTSNSSFEVSFDVKAIGFMWPDNWTGPGEFSRERWITVWCPNVKVEIVTKTGLGTMAGEPLKCEVETSKML